MIKQLLLVALLTNAITCHAQVEAPNAAPTPWRWGAKVDESVFAPGGKGVTIYAAPTGAPDADGSVAKPLSLDDAMRRASEAVRSMEAEYQRVSQNTAAPQWLKITRRGDQFAAFSAPDEDGKPGAWTPAGEAVSIRMGRDVFAGVTASSNQRFPRGGTFGQATWDYLSVAGRSIPDAAWQSIELGSAPDSSHTVKDGKVIVRGNGYDVTSKNNWADSAHFAYVPMQGDGEFVARLSNLTPSEHSKQVVASLMLRDVLDAGARMMEIKVAIKGDNSGLWSGFRSDRATPGQNVKVVLSPGIYRSQLRLPERDLVAQNHVFAVEGARANGQTGSVVISGSEEWKPTTWQEDGNSVFSHDWTRNWGGKELQDRREMVFLTAPGGAMQRLRPVLLANWKQEPGTFAVDEEKDRLMLRLPTGWDAAKWNDALVEVATNDGHLLGFGTFNSRGDDNLVLRNLVFQHNAGGGTVQMNWWPEPKEAPRNWLFEDITIRQNAGEGFRLNHLRDFTMRRVVSIDNGTQNHMIAAEGQMIDCAIDRNGWRKRADTFWNSLKNVYVYNSSFSGNNGNGFRNDHVAENLLMENCRFNDNSLMSVMFETATGPITIRNSEIKNNNFGAGESDDAAVGLATVHNITFDGVTFENNHRSAISFYPRERAHTAVQEGHDELNNNLDFGHWDTDDTPEGRWTPGGKKAASENRNFVIKNCTFLANKPSDRFIIQHFYRRGPAYQRNIREELRAYNNRYYNPAQVEAFQLDNASWRPDPGDTYGTFAQWKAVSTQPNFEAGSAWGQSAPRNFTPPAPVLAKAGTNAKPQSANGRLTYEVENLPFKATNGVELLAAPGEANNRLHKLQVEQIGDYGDWIEYTLDVPQTGDYYLDVRYLQDAGAFNYLGYAQLQIDRTPVGDWWDQHGLTTQLMSHHIGPVRLTAGSHTFRFDSVWRNGYGSGDYDITVDRITLLNALNARPATKAAPAQTGLTYQLFEGGDWTRLPDFNKLKAQDSGMANSFDIGVADENEKFGIRFSGSIEVPRDGIYTFATTVNDGANLYIDDLLVVDNDGVHDGEKDEPWQKRGNIALAAGRHAIRVDYFESGGKGKSLQVLWAPQGGELKAVTPTNLGVKNYVAGPMPVGPSLLNGNTAKMEVFTKRVKGNTSLEETGAWPQPWSVNLWDANSVGEIVLEKDPVTQRNAIALRNLEGQPALQFYTWKNIDLPVGNYELRFDYMTGGDTGGEVFLNFKDREDKKTRLELPASPGAWKRISHTIDATEALALSPQFRVSGMGADKALYLRNISLRRLQQP